MGLTENEIIEKCAKGCMLRTEKTLLPYGYV